MIWSEEFLEPVDTTTWKNWSILEVGQYEETLVTNVEKHMSNSDDLIRGVFGASRYNNLRNKLDPLQTPTEHQLNFFTYMVNIDGVKCSKSSSQVITFLWKNLR